MSTVLKELADIASVRYMTKLIVYGKKWAGAWAGTIVLPFIDNMNMSKQLYYRMQWSSGSRRGR